MSKKLYDTDFYAWTQSQSKIVESSSFGEMDLENIAIELSALGENQRFNLMNDIRQIIIKLLELNHADEASKPKLVEKITELRDQAENILEISPSLYLYASKSFDEFNISNIEQLTLDQVLSHDYWCAKTIY